MSYRPILGTLGYILSPDEKEVLLIHRNRKEGDYHVGKYNGLGGKMESSEDAATGMKREIFEEAGIECTSMQLRGIINWEGFGPNGQDWLGFVFLIHTFSGKPLSENPEGTLKWVPVESLTELPMWEGDRHFLPLVFDRDPRVFYGYMPYVDGKLKSWSFERF